MNKAQFMFAGSLIVTFILLLICIFAPFWVLEWMAIIMIGAIALYALYAIVKIYIVLGGK